MNQWSNVTLADRFWARVDKHGPILRPEIGRCWVWPTVRRYGSIYAAGKRQQATRVAWFLATGQWPVLNVLHKCDNGKCVRFSHLFEGTQGDNVRDMESKGRSVHNPRRGEEVFISKLDRKSVERIRKLYATDKYTQEALAAIFKVSQTNIGFVVRGITWAE